MAIKHSRMGSACTPSPDPFPGLHQATARRLQGCPVQDGPTVDIVQGRGKRGGWATPEGAVSDCRDPRGPQGRSGVSPGPTCAAAAPEPRAQSQACRQGGVAVGTVWRGGHSLFACRVSGCRADAVTSQPTLPTAQPPGQCGGVTLTSSPLHWPQPPGKAYVKGNPQVSLERTSGLQRGSW